MTKAKALEVLKTYDMSEDNEDREFCEALTMAISALEQKPCEDAISRDAVYEILMRSDFRDTCSYETFKKRLDALPSVTQKSETVTEFADRCRECGKMRKGHWIYDETLENWRCSKCNETPKTMGYVGTADFMAEHFKFCNHCGAKMVEPQESEDKCKNCEYYRNPDYTRCHECKAESEDKE